MANKIVLNDGVNIGQNGAEFDDEFLFNCFVDHPAYSEITDVNTPTTFLLGSTGAGKTAILRMIARQEDNVSDLVVHDMAMNYIANSDTIQFLKTLDVDLSLFFQALWKHIFCIEYIKVATRARDKSQFKNRFSGLLRALTGGKAKDKLEKFVENHEEQFWNTIDENVIELTDSLESGFNASFGGEIKKFNAKAGWVHNLGTQQKVQLQQRARRFLNQSTLSELPSVISALSDYTRGRQDCYFITVDGLDEHWVDEDIKFQLLQAMFESLKSLKKLRNFQVVVALRNDLYVRMIRETPSARRQIEKYDDLIIRLRWSKSQLKELAEKRIGEMCRKQYSSENVKFSDVFKQNPTTRETPWDYIYERTLRRPRDVINFINLAMGAAEGRSAVSKNAFLKGEANYSDLRLDTLVHEWSGTFPGIRVLLELLREMPAYRNASEMVHSKLLDDLYDSLGQSEKYHSDEIWNRISQYVVSSEPLEPLEIVQMVLYRLHMVGAIGLKLREDRPWEWIFDTNRTISEQQISRDTKFRVHPMLYAALSVKK
ncbi:P-loop ATPase, Sll1717 family [Pararhodobacter oceanensis]|uniref:P-loop ATPase, Sll1717 family n=1 Tax=Pararhodobacter oceanensis TaxID=2172121 RepID=UPI003A906D27